MILGAVTVILCLLASSALSILKKYNLRTVDLVSFFGKPQQMLDSTNGFTNLLLLGIRGEGADSPNLSDTIIVVSYNHPSKTTAIISIPRDLWVPSLKAKVNTAYHYGEEASSGAGIKLAQASVLETIGLPVHYTAVVDFALFKDVINLLSGVDVYNEVAFTDNEFPIPGKETVLPISARYETISFVSGTIHMDGDTALKYVRSRHSTGESGTDFDRSRRQQAVISAIKAKILNPDFILKQKKITDLISLVNTRLKTNISPTLYPSLAKRALDMQSKPIRSIGLSDRPDSDGVAILYNPPTKFYSGEWVLIPKQNNWSALKQYVKNKIEGIQ